MKQQMSHDRNTIEEHKKELNSHENEYNNPKKENTTGRILSRGLQGTKGAKLSLRQWGWFRLTGVIVSVAISLLILYPLALVVFDVLGMGGQGSIIPEIWQEIRNQQTLQVLLTTVTLVVPAGLIALVVAAVLAWVNERTNARIGLLADVTPLVPMFVPPIATAIGWIILASPNAGLLNEALDWVLGLFGVESSFHLDIFTWFGLFFVYVLDLVPFAYIAMAPGFRNLDASTEEAAKVSGAGSLETFRRVTLPSLGPSLGGAFLITMSVGFALFSTPVAIGTGAGIDILSVEIVDAMTGTFPPDEPRAMAYGLLLLIMVTFMWWLQQRMVGKSGYATVGGKGIKNQLTDLGSWRWFARLIIVLYLILSSALPIFALLIVSLQPFWGSAIDVASLSFDNYRNVFGSPFIADALYNSLLVGVICATAGVAVAAVVARMVHGERGVWTKVIEAITRVPAAVPILVFALAFITAFVGPPFGLGGTLLLLGIAYVAIFFPHAAINASSAYLQIGAELKEAGQVFGVSETRAFFRIFLPLMFPGLISGWAFLFVLIAGDVTVSAMLASTGTPVVGYTILDLYNNGTFPSLAALAVLTTALTTFVVTMAMAFSRWHRNRYS